MGNFEQTCKQIDARFDKIMGTDSTDEPEAVMLIRAAARMVMTTYPASRLKDRVLDGLLESAGQLKTMHAGNDD